MATDRGRLTVVVPVKPLSEAKGRLASVLGAEERGALSLLMLSRTLLAVRGSAGVDDVWVVGGDAAVRRLAGGLGARWLSEPGADLNDSLGKAIDRAFAAGADAALFLPGDLPLLTSSALEAFLAESLGLERGVIAPAEGDGGTNALLLPRRLAFRTLLGPDSFRRHLAAFRERGHAPAVHRSLELAFDLDTPEDWATLQRLRPDLARGLPEWVETLRRLSGLEPRSDPTDVRIDAGSGEA